MPMASATLNEAMIGRMVEILRRHGVTRAGIFGSFARGEADETSDVDVLIAPPQGMTLFGLARLERELAAAVGRQVDVITYNSLQPGFRDEVLREQVIIL